MPLAGRVPSFRPRFPPGFLFSMKSGMEKAKMSPNTLCFPKKKKRKKKKTHLPILIDNILDHLTLQGQISLASFHTYI